MPKICPLRLVGNKHLSKGDVNSGSVLGQAQLRITECLGQHCAWWSAYHSQCVIRTIGELALLSGTVERAIEREASSD